MVLQDGRYLLPTIQSDLEEFTMAALGKIAQNKAIVLRALSVLEKSMVRAQRKHQDDGLTEMAALVKVEVDKIAIATTWILEMPDEGKAPSRS